VNERPASELFVLTHDDGTSRLVAHEEVGSQQQTSQCVAGDKLTAKVTHDFGRPLFYKPKCAQFSAGTCSKSDHQIFRNESPFQVRQHLQLVDRGLNGEGKRNAVVTENQCKGGTSACKLNADLLSDIDKSCITQSVQVHEREAEAKNLFEQFSHELKN
jgi:hypothetical protein